MDKAPIGSLLSIPPRTPPPSGLSRRAMIYWLGAGGAAPGPGYEYVEPSLWLAPRRAWDS